MRLSYSRISDFFQSYDDTIAGVPVRIYTPVNKNDDSAMIVFFHGGGFATGNVGKCLHSKAKAHHFYTNCFTGHCDLSWPALALCWSPLLRVLYAVPCLKLGQYLGTETPLCPKMIF